MKKQICNYIIESLSADEHEYIVIKTVGGFLEIKYRDDNIIYGYILECLKSEEYEELLRAYIVANFGVVGIPPDARLLHDIFILLDDYINRKTKEMDDLTEEEEDDALRSALIEHELKAEIDNIEQELSDDNKE